MTSVRNPKFNSPAYSLLLSLLFNYLTINIFIYLFANEWEVPFVFFFFLMLKWPHWHTHTPAGPQCSLRHSIWRYRVTFPKQHHPKLWQFAGRTLIAVAGAQVLHAKHSAAKSVMSVYECVCLWAREFAFACVLAYVCVCACVLVSGRGGGTGGPSALFCSSALI